MCHGQPFSDLLTKVNHMTSHKTWNKKGCAVQWIVRRQITNLKVWNCVISTVLLSDFFFFFFFFKSDKYITFCQHHLVRKNSSTSCSATHNAKNFRILTEQFEQVHRRLRQHLFYFWHWLQCSRSLDFWPAPDPPSTEPGCKKHLHHLQLTSSLLAPSEPRCRLTPAL